MLLCWHSRSRVSEPRQLSPSSKVWPRSGLNWPPMGADCAGPQPSCLQTTCASSKLQSLSQTPYQVALYSTSTRPEQGPGPSLTRSCKGLVPAAESRGGEVSGRTALASNPTLSGQELTQPVLDGPPWSLWIYLSTPHRHPHCGHSCALPSFSARTPQRWTLSPRSAHCPAKWGPTLAQNELSLVLTLPSHSPAPCTQLQHRLCPTCHHTRSPTSGREEPQLSQCSCSIHSPAAADGASMCPCLRREQNARSYLIISCRQALKCIEPWKN